MSNPNQWRPIGRHAITWCNDIQINWRIYASSMTWPVNNGADDGLSPISICQLKQWNPIRAYFLGLFYASLVQDLCVMLHLHQWCHVFISLTYIWLQICCNRHVPSWLSNPGPQRVDASPIWHGTSWVKYPMIIVLNHFRNAVGMELILWKCRISHNN